MLTCVGPDGGLASAVAGLIPDLLASPTTEGLALVEALPPAPAAGIEALSDDDIEASVVGPLADLAAILGDLVGGHHRIVIIARSSYLGGWDSGLSGAFAAGVAGLMRSVALEFMHDGVTINMVAVPDDDPERAPQVAALCAALLLADGVNGQVIPCDRGDNLRMTAARPRSPARPPASAED